MRKAGRSAKYVFGVWGANSIICGIASLVGYAVFAGLPTATHGGVMALAAGAILAMLADTMMPEAFADTHAYAGLITVSGFLAAFLLDKVLG
jgi:ZIP family zinc transporter